jgi:uncharacterized protein (TIGR02246 family)
MSLFYILILLIVVTEDQRAIKAVLLAYREALNSSSTEEVMKLYSPDSIFMPQHFPTTTGIDAIRETYDKIFHTITLTVEFNIGDIIVTGSGWGFVNTSSVGTTKSHANGQVSTEGNQELFIFQKFGEEWKIARYCFCTTNPPK